VLKLTYLLPSPQPSAALCRTLTLHGVEATGKTSIAKGLLASLSSHVPALRHAIIHAGRCITARHLFESIVAAVAEALEDDDNDAHGASARCETLAQLDVELCRLLKYRQHDDDFRFVLVLDAIDRARDAPTTLMPALARMSEIVRPPPSL
jgi:origin recognition complex subunit 5